MSALHILIPTYNDEATVCDTLQSLCDQSIPPRRVTIVDDCSADRTVDIAEQFRNRLTLDIVLGTHRLGLVGNWNRCVALALEDATNAFIWILHSDDWLHPQAVELLGTVLTPEVGLVSVGAHFLSDRACHEAETWANRSQGVFEHFDAGGAGITQAMGFICSAVVVNRRCYEELGLFSAAFPYSPDEEAWPRFAAHFAGYAYQGGALVGVRASGDHFMHETWRKPDFFAQWALIHRKIEDYVHQVVAPCDEPAVIASVRRHEESVRLWVREKLNCDDRQRTLKRRIARRAIGVARKTSKSLRRVLHWDDRLRYSEQLRILRKALVGCQTLLDLGCGSRSPLSQLQWTFSIGVELHEESAETAEQFQTHTRIVRAPVIEYLKSLPDGSIDAVVALDLIEHLPKSEGWILLHEMRRVCSRCVVVTTPNGFLPQDADENEFQRHLSGWSPEDFKSKGFSVCGLFGPAKWRTEYHRLKMRPAFLWALPAYLMAEALRRSPQHSAALFCVYDSSRTVMNAGVNTSQGTLSAVNCI